VATAADCAATLVMFDEKVLRYHLMGRHDPGCHDTLNMLVTLYGQRERLAARSIVKHLITPEEFEMEASAAATAWLTELSRPIFVAWTLTLVVQRLLQVSQGELVTLYGNEYLSAARQIAQTQTVDRCERFVAGAQLTEMDWWTTCASGTEMAMAVTCALVTTRRSQPLDSFLRFATLTYDCIQSQES
jgi:hypothetical protein